MTRPLTAPGRLVAGRYRLAAELGGGGMGTVWLARDELLGREVAVKQVLPGGSADGREASRQRERALREGRIAARLSNAHAISVYDVAVDDDQPWLVMEYLPSRSLAAVLAEDGLLQVDQVAQIGAQVADGLAATHAAGIVHRDVKPANVLIGRGDRVEGIVKITDFGISHASGDVTLTQTGQITGTPAFLAPEVAQGEEPTAASDVFSLGATLYTCLEGQPPFGMGDNALQLLHKVASGQIEPPRHAGSMTAPLLQMLEADPGARPTMVRVRDELARIAAGRDGDPTTVLLARTRLRGTAGRPPTAPFPPVPPPATPDARPAAGPAEPAAAPAPDRGSRPAGRRRRPVALAVGAALAVAALVAVLLTRTGGGPTTASGPSPSTSPPPASSASSAPATSVPATSAATSSARPPSSASGAPSSTAAAAPATGAGDPAAFLSGYHALLPGDTASAYRLTGPRLRSAESYADYQAFWHRFRAVSLSGVQVQSPTSATGVLTYTTTDGRQQRELHRFTLVRGQGGELLLDGDDFVQAL